MSTATVAPVAHPHLLDEDLLVSTPRPLRVVAPARRRRPRVAYAVVAVIGALLIAGAQMGLSILTTQSTFDISSVAQQQRTLNLQKQVLNDKITGLTSPQYLAANAAALGMVTGQSPSYLRLSDGAVLGPQRASNATSSLDALGNGSVPNALIATTPLVSNAQATINGAIAPTPDPAASAAAANPATPPALTDGLPTPATH